MTDTDEHELSEQLKPWLTVQIDAAVEYLGDHGIFESAYIEAKPAWALPGEILIGKARERGEATAFRWFICGTMPLDHIGSEAAETPRAAARHFALKWQLEAARIEKDAGDSLARYAEDLYALAEEDKLWADPPA